MNRIDLDGRRAVVTGGAQGIGRAIAERLLASGASVTIWDRDPGELESTREALGAGTGGVVVDVADPGVRGTGRGGDRSGRPGASTSSSTTPASRGPTPPPGSTRSTSGAR